MIIELKDRTRNKRVENPRQMGRILRKILKSEDEIDRDKEHFWVIYLNSREKIKLLELVSLGTLTEGLVHPREVFGRAVSNRIARIVVAHNHPSGDVEPSEDDLEITHRLKKAGEILGIEVIDHIIISEKGFFSFKEKGLL